jgi:hypothetical protein
MQNIVVFWDKKCLIIEQRAWHLGRRARWVIGELPCGEGTMTFPSEFMLVAAMNPAPDGKMARESRCSPREIQSYLGRISGPPLDRIDLHIEVPPVKFREIISERTGESSVQIRELVVAARRRQHERFAAGLAVSLSETGDGNVLLVDMNLQGATRQFYKGNLAFGLDDALELEKREGALVQDHLYIVKESSNCDQLPRVLPQRFTQLVPKMKASD